MEENNKIIKYKCILIHDNHKMTQEKSLHYSEVETMCLSCFFSAKSIFLLKSLHHVYTKLFTKKGVFTCCNADLIDWPTYQLIIFLLGKPTPWGERRGLLMGAYPRKPPVKFGTFPSKRKYFTAQTEIRLGSDNREFYQIVKVMFLLSSRWICADSLITIESYY